MTGPWCPACRKQVGTVGVYVPPNGFYELFAEHDCPGSGKRVQDADYGFVKDEEIVPPWQAYHACWYTVCPHGAPFQALVTERFEKCPLGGVCIRDSEWGHPCDRDENGDYLEACDKRLLMRATACPVCGDFGGFHHPEQDRTAHDTPLPEDLRHLARPPASQLRAERPKGKPSDEEIARRREAKRLAKEST